MNTNQDFLETESGELIRADTVQSLSLNDADGTFTARLSTGKAAYLSRATVEQLLGKKSPPKRVTK